MGSLYKISTDAINRVSEQMEPEQTLSCSTLTHLPTVARQIIDFARDTSVWLFYGDMGAGKTTLIKALCCEWGVEDTVSSPTFALVNEYQRANGEPLYHFDFYRIDDEEEAVDIGVDEYFYSQRYCLVEWPAKIRNLLPETYIRIDLCANEDQSRTISLSRHEQPGYV